MEEKDYWVNKNKDMFKTKEEYVAAFGRPIADNEIVIEFDYPCPSYELAVVETENTLLLIGYNVEIWKAEGMQCAHIHIKNISGLNILPEKIRKKYKEEFIRDYVSPIFIQYVDWSLCGKSKIAAERKPHFKYGTILKKVGSINSKEINSVERHLVKRAEILLQKETFQKRHFRTDRNKPGESIIEVAENYGLDVGENGMVLCPFHDDTMPSLSLNEEMGAFNCFGCNKHGNISEFKKLLEGLK